MSFSVKDKVALVTGAANRGIGKSIVEAAAEERGLRGVRGCPRPGHGPPTW